MIFFAWRDTIAFLLFVPPSTVNSLTTSSGQTSVPARNRYVFASKCRTCGITPAGIRTCCGTGGAWEGKCGDVGGDKEYTWVDGREACQSEVEVFESEAQALAMRKRHVPTSTNLIVDVHVKRNVNTEDPVKTSPLIVFILIIFAP